MPRQFDNPANPDIHAATTAEEIWTDTGGRVDIVVGGAGTGGTLTGIARALKPRRPGLRMVLVEPAESAVLSGDEAGPHGVQGIGPGFQPAVLELGLMDEVVRVSEREAIAAARRCARDGRAADRHFLRRRAACGAGAGARAGECGQADRFDRAQLCRALSQHAAVRGAVSKGRPGLCPGPASALARLGGAGPLPS